VRVTVEGDPGERRSAGGILIPATAAMGGRRLEWSRVVAVGQNVRQVEVGDRVLFDPQDRGEVELQSKEYVLLREKDLHAVAAARVSDDGGQTGLYL
jgi:chaperonin GroES